MPLFNRTRLTLFKSIMPKSMSKGQERYLKALVLVFLLLLLVLTIAHTEDNPDWYFVVPGLIIHLSAESFLILITSAFVAVATRHFIIPIILYVRGRSQWEWDPRPLAFWLVITKGIALYFIDLSATNSNISSYLNATCTFFNSIFVIFLTVFLLRVYLHYFVPFLSRVLLAIETDTQYGPILEIIGSIVIIIFGLAKFLNQFDVDIGVLLAGIGVAGLVIALAAQDTLSNFFSGILLLLDQGFKTGDMVYFDGDYCIIRDFGLRSTKLYNIIEHVVVIIPNNAFASQNIVNVTKPDRYVRHRINVGVSYDSNPSKVEEVLLKVAAGNTDVETDDPTRKPIVRFQSFGESSLEFVLVLWIKNVIKIRQVNSDLHHEIFTNLRKAKVVIAYPQRDVHLHEVS